MTSLQPHTTSLSLRHESSSLHSLPFLNDIDCRHKWTVHFVTMHNQRLRQKNRNTAVRTNSRKYRDTSNRKGPTEDDVDVLEEESSVDRNNTNNSRLNKRTLQVWKDCITCRNATSFLRGCVINKKQPNYKDTTSGGTTTKKRQRIASSPTTSSSKEENYVTVEWKCCNTICSSTTNEQQRGNRENFLLCIYISIDEQITITIYIFPILQVCLTRYNTAAVANKEILLQQFLHWIQSVTDTTMQQQFYSNTAMQQQPKISFEILMATILVLDVQSDGTKAVTTSSSSTVVLHTPFGVTFCIGNRTTDGLIDTISLRIAPDSANKLLQHCYNKIDNKNKKSSSTTTAYRNNDGFNSSSSSSSSDDVDSSRNSNDARVKNDSVDKNQTRRDLQQLLLNFGTLFTHNLKHHIQEQTSIQVVGSPNSRSSILNISVERVVINGTTISIMPSSPQQSSKKIQIKPSSCSTLLQLLRSIQQQQTIETI